MAYRIPLFDLNFDQKEESAVIETIASKWISIGPKCQEFEDDFARLFEVDHAISITNCTAALHLALLALDIQAGDEVLCPSLSFAATANCIKYVGAIPVFCDIVSLQNPTISFDEIKRKTTAKTKAIIVMHYAGYPCEMNKIMDFAHERGLKVVEDACHAPLSEYQGKKLGSFGDLACYSFFSNKNISTGEGGMIITNNSELAGKVKLLRSHGMSTMSYERSKGHATSYDITELGFNFRMDDIRASIGIVQLQKLSPDLKKRAEVRSWYLENLRDEKRVMIPFLGIEDFSSNYIFPVVVLDPNVRDDLRDALHKKGIQTSLHYPPIHKFSIYDDQTLKLPETELYAKSTLTLPMYGNLTQEDVKFICESIQQSLNEV